MSDPRPDPVDPVSLPANPVKAGKTDMAEYRGRRAKAVRLRLSGLTYQQVADGAGYAHASNARHAVLAALRDVEVDDVATMRETEGARLDAQRAVLWGLAMGSPAVPASVGPDGEIREAVDAVPPDLDAHLRLLQVSRQYCQLMGLNAPVQVEILENIDQQLGELRAKLATDDGLFVVTDLPERPKPEGEPE